MGSKIYGVVLLAIITCFAASDGLDDDDNGGLLSLRIVGNVFCDTCHEKHFSKNSYFISGASVVVECRNNKQTPDFRIEAKTNDYGQFNVELPPSIFHSYKQFQRCSTTLLQNEEQRGPCKLVSIANSSSFTLKSKQGSIHTYSVGSFSYRPQSPFPFCSQDAAKKPKSDLKAPLQSSKTFGFPSFFLPPPLPRSPSRPSARTPSLPSPLNFPPLSFPFPTSPSLPFPFPFPTSPSLPFPFPFQTPPSLPFPFPFPTTPSLPFPFPFPAAPSFPFPFPFPTPPSLHIPNPVETHSIDSLPSIPLEKTPTLVPQPPH